MLDGSITQSASTIMVAPRVSQPNLAYSYWLCVNQLIQARIFATISKDTLCEVQIISHTLPIWKLLISCFNNASLARALDLNVCSLIY